MNRHSLDVVFDDALSSIVYTLTWETGDSGPLGRGLSEDAEGHTEPLYLTSEGEGLCVGQVLALDILVEKKRYRTRLTVSKGPFEEFTKHHLLMLIYSSCFHKERIGEVGLRTYKDGWELLVGQDEEDEGEDAKVWPDGEDLVWMRSLYNIIQSLGLHGKFTRDMELVFERWDMQGLSRALQQARKR